MGTPGDEHDLANPRAYQSLDREADHGAVVEREQVLVCDARKRMEPAARAAGKDDALHCPDSIGAPLAGTCQPTQGASTVGCLQLLVADWPLHSDGETRQLAEDDPARRPGRLLHVRP